MQNNNPADREIVEAIRSEKSLDATVRHLYRQHFDALANYVRSNSGKEEDAEDFFQEVLVVFIDTVKKGKFRGDSSIKTFLYAIMRNLWLNELKRRSNAQRRETTYYEQSETEEDARESVHESETLKQILTFFERLGENCKKILVMYYYQELSMKDIAAAMHYDSEQVARNTKYKCSKKLTTILDSNPALKDAFRNLLTHR